MVFSPIEGVCDTPKEEKRHSAPLSQPDKGQNKRQGLYNLCRFILDLCFLNNYLLAVIITALGAKSVRSLEFTAV